MDTFGKSGPIGDVIGDVISVGSLKYRIGFFIRTCGEFLKWLRNREIERPRRFETQRPDFEPRCCLLVGSYRNEVGCN